MEQCPHCGARFEARAAIVDLGQARGPLNLPAIPPRVGCPGCRREFAAQNYRYLGFISPGQLRLALVVAVMAVAVIGVAFLFMQDPTWTGGP